MTFLLILLFSLASFAGIEAAPANCEAFFSPKDHLARRLIDLIDRETKSIKVAVYCMTHREIADALVRAKERGVAIEVIVDPFSVKQRSSVHLLLRGKVPLFVWDQELSAQVRSMPKKREQRALMHDKFCVFGDHMVWTGSFNFTYDATSAHQENVVTLESKEVAGKYLDQFAQMKLYETRPYNEYLAYHPKKGKKK
jgi:phosphatidylserine/phosphatidylglycerophosphate/cardiolipin synthase-like enzyme